MATDTRWALCEAHDCCIVTHDGEHVEALNPGAPGRLIDLHNEVLAEQIEDTSAVRVLARQVIDAIETAERGADALLHQIDYGS